MEIMIIFLHSSVFLMLHFHHVYVDQPKLCCFAENPPERNRLIIELIFIISTL